MLGFGQLTFLVGHTSSFSIYIFKKFISFEIFLSMLLLLAKSLCPHQQQPIIVCEE